MESDLSAVVVGYMESILMTHNRQTSSLVLCFWLLLFLAAVTGVWIVGVRVSFPYKMKKANVHLSEGNKYLQHGRYREAISEYKEAQKYYPNWRIAEDNLRIAESGQALDTRVSSHPNDDQMRKELFDRLMREGRLSEAREQAKRFIDPDRRGFCLMLANRATDSSVGLQEELADLLVQFVGERKTFPSSLLDLKSFSREDQGRKTVLSNCTNVVFKRLSDKSLLVSYDRVTSVGHTEAKSLTITMP